LVTRLSFLGDIVLSTPVLSTLREHCREASIEYLCLEAYAPALQQHPCVDRVHALPRNAGLADTFKMVKALRQPRVDWWIDLFGNPRSAMLCLLAQPRISVGTDRGVRTRVYQHRMGAAEDNPSAVAHHLNKLRPLLGPIEERPVSLAVSDEERIATRARFGLEVDERPVLLHAGSTWPSKAWPEPKWSRLIDALSADGFQKLWVMSAPGDEARANRIVAGACAPATAIEPLSLREVFGLLAESRAYIGNDGGILHSAIALRTPTVGIFGPTEPEIWFPHLRSGACRLAQEFVACRPCHLHECDHLSCLEALPVSRVRDLLHEVLADQRSMSVSA